MEVIDAEVRGVEVIRAEVTGVEVTGVEVMVVGGWVVLSDGRRVGLSLA